MLGHLTYGVFFSILTRTRLMRMKNKISKTRMATKMRSKTTMMTMKMTTKMWRIS